MLFLCFFPALYGKTVYAKDPYNYRKDEGTVNTERRIGNPIIPENNIPVINTNNSGNTISNTNNQTRNVTPNQTPTYGGVDGNDTVIQDSKSKSFKNSLVSLEDLKDKDKKRDINLDSFNGKKGVYEAIIKIAKDIREIFYIIASLYFFIITLRLITASNTEEELGKFKKGILWISIGILVINLAIYIVDLVYKPAGEQDTPDFTSIANNLLTGLAYPLIKLLETATAFFFLLVALFAFFRLITSNGNEEEAKRGKMTILYAVLGIILIVIASELVFAVYGNCSGNLSQFASLLKTSCKASANLGGITEIIVNIIKWLNGFVAVIVILMIIYSGGRLMISGGEDEVVSKAKKSIIYIIIGIAILIMNYFILTFFLQ
ncbi:hypothetical protein KGV52_01455 [Candidatus Gracilibacteria bacterium]|nr:hypothetical protein [Candidatus Gracilibacteria bacterium]